MQVRRLSEGDIEVAIGELSLEFHAESGEHAIQNAENYYHGQFKAADKDNNKYLEKSEVKDHGPFAALFDTIDVDGDGKLYMKEVDAFVDQQAHSCAQIKWYLRCRSLTRGARIFAIIDLQSRPPAARSEEIRDAVARVFVLGSQQRWTYRLRRDSSPFMRCRSAGARSPVVLACRRTSSPGCRRRLPCGRAPAGPSWFRKMDRNGDGDISHREFLGPRAPTSKPHRQQPRRPHRCGRSGQSCRKRRPAAK